MGDIVTIGDAVLYHGDCLDLLEKIGPFDCLVTDPPYGIGEASGKNASRSFLAVSKDYGDDTWDDSPAVEEVALSVKMAKQAIVFGGNYYDLPPSSCWLVWDKENGSTDFADAELAWTNLQGAVRLKRYMWHGMLRANKEKRGDHPHAKTDWHNGMGRKLTKGLVVDPMMGSGTTGVACANLGRSFVGIERERKYFDIACERIDAAYAQGRLFA